MVIKNEGPEQIIRPTSINILTHIVCIAFLLSLAVYYKIEMCVIRRKTVMQEW